MHFSTYSEVHLFSYIIIFKKSLEKCFSRDFNILEQLGECLGCLAFKDFGYQPVTEMVTYTGKTAEAFAQLF